MPARQARPRGIARIWFAAEFRQLAGYGVREGLQVAEQRGHEPSNVVRANQGRDKCCQTVRI